MVEGHGDGGKSRARLRMDTIGVDVGERDGNEGKAQDVWMGNGAPVIREGGIAIEQDVTIEGDDAGLCAIRVAADALTGVFDGDEFAFDGGGVIIGMEAEDGVIIG